MLSYFYSVTVPVLEPITVFRDDENATQFYAMLSTPRPARDSQGRLLLDLIIYAGDADKLGLLGRPSGCRPGIAAGPGHVVSYQGSGPRHSKGRGRNGSSIPTQRRRTE